MGFKAVNDGINIEFWETIHCAAFCPLPKPETWKIPRKANNHISNDVMKMYKI